MRTNYKIKKNYQFKFWDWTELAIALGIAKKKYSKKVELEEKEDKVIEDLRNLLCSYYFIDKSVFETDKKAKIIYKICKKWANGFAVNCNETGTKSFWEGLSKIDDPLSFFKYLSILFTNMWT